MHNLNLLIMPDIGDVTNGLNKAQPSKSELKSKV